MFIGSFEEIVQLSKQIRRFGCVFYWVLFKVLEKDFRETSGMEILNFFWKSGGNDNDGASLKFG